MWKLRLWPQTFVLHWHIFETFTYFKFVFHWKGRGSFCFVYNFSMVFQKQFKNKENSGHGWRKNNQYLDYSFE